MNILQINSSARREGSHSTRLATRLVQRLRDADPEATLTVRDLSTQCRIRFSTKPRFGALFTPADATHARTGCARRAGRRIDCGDPGRRRGGAGRADVQLRRARAIEELDRRDFAGAA